MTSKNSAPITDHWDSPLHESHKTRPNCSQLDYPHHVDLNEFIRSQGTSARVVMLDYGAGASPYKKYFPNADYRRADITGTASLRYQIQADSTIAEADETFDLILSTQVAEHVVNPDIYFKECFRLLKKSGVLILTTHGIWDEHGSPYDFQRWTGEGLRRDLEKAGFNSEHLNVYKLTCGMRAALLIFTRTLFTMRPPAQPVRKWLFKAFRFSYSRIFALLYRLADKWWPEDKLVQTEKENPIRTWYIVIAAIARK
jgi:SAM-dependent methyltransferase